MLRDSSKASGYKYKWIHSNAVVYIMSEYLLIKFRKSSAICILRTTHLQNALKEIKRATIQFLAIE
jgi:hypothetical protein